MINNKKSWVPSQNIGLNHHRGFTLIELMIVIAIIGILAAIAIPNFVSYRAKSFCSAAETDADTVLAAISDYFSNPVNLTVSEASLNIADGPVVIYPMAILIRSLR